MFSTRRTPDSPTPLSRVAIRFIVCGAAALLGWTPAVRAQTPPDRLSLAEAIALARESNPSHRMQQEQLRSAAWNVRAAVGNLLPSVSATTGVAYTAGGERRLEDVRLSSQPATYSSRYGLGMGLQLNGNALLGPSLARAHQRAEEEGLLGSGAALEAEVTRRYLSVMEATAAVEQSERELSRAVEHVRGAQARFDVGAGTRLEIRQAEVQRGQAEVRLLQARNAADTETLLLGLTIGMLLPSGVELTERFELFEPTWSAGELTELAARSSPSLNASRATAEAAATRLRVARSAYLPTISIGAGLSGFISESALGTSSLVAQEIRSQENRFAACLEENQIRTAAGLGPHPCNAPADEATLRGQLEARNRFPFDYVRQPMTASLTISLPLFNGFERELQVEQARVARVNAQQEVRLQELRVRVNLETALRNLETAYRSALLQREIRASAQDELLLAEERFRLGLASSIEVLDAQTNLASAERAEIAAVYEFHRLVATLEAEVGQALR